MELYNALIRAARGLYDAAPLQRWAYCEADAWADSGESELVMLRDAAYELGGSGNPSANFTCATSDEALVPRDEILLCGRDLPQLTGDVSFARLVFLQVDEILGEDDEATFQAIRDMEFIKYHVFPKGYMVRISSESNREQVRVSRNALRSGISFRRIGASYIRAYHRNPHVKRVQVVFLTGHPAIADLAQAAKKVDDITKTLTHILEGLPTDCGSCTLKPICDEVEGMREMHFGKAKQQKK